jgi:hypothetical protein
MPDKRGAFKRSLQHHLVNLLFRAGVYERGETSETGPRRFRLRRDPRYAELLKQTPLPM